MVSVSLEELVPQDHFYRHLQQILDLSFVHQLVREHYAIAGRPSIDPVVFFKLQLVMFFENIRSERLLMRQVADRLSLRWYIGYDVDESLPDHSTLSKIRQRYGLDVFRRFAGGHRPTMSRGQIGMGQGVVLRLKRRVNANADLDSLAPRFAIEAREAIQEHLSTLFASEPAQPETVEASSGNATLPEPLPTDTSALLPSTLPTAISEAQYEELAQDNATRHDWIAEGGRKPREAHGLYRRTAD